MSRGRGETAAEQPRGAGPKRGRSRERLSRERVIRAAVQLMDKEGLDGLTMRRLGRALGVEAMSLYHHVRDKEDVLQGALEAILGEFEMPREEDVEWTERIRELARALRRLLHRHPNAVPLLAEQRGPVLSTEALRPIEAALDALRGAGLSQADTLHAYRALVGYVFGYVLLETGGLFADKASAPEWPDPATLAGLLPVDRLPRIFELLPAFLECDPDEEFEYGLDVLLAGLAARLLPASTAARSAPSARG